MALLELLLHKTSNYHNNLISVQSDFMYFPAGLLLQLSNLYFLHGCTPAAVYYVVQRSPHLEIKFSQVLFTEEESCGSDGDGGCMADRRKHLEAETGENRWEKRVWRDVSVWEQPITGPAFHTDPDCCLLHNVVAPLSKLDALTSIGNNLCAKMIPYKSTTLQAENGWMSVAGEVSF